MAHSTKAGLAVIPLVASASGSFSLTGCVVGSEQMVGSLLVVVNGNSITTSLPSRRKHSHAQARLAGDAAAAAMGKAEEVGRADDSGQLLSL